MTSAPTCTSQLKFCEFLGLCTVTVNCNIDGMEKYEDTDEIGLKATKWSLSKTIKKHNRTLEACEAMRVAELQSAYKVTQAENDKFNKK